MDRRYEFRFKVIGDFRFPLDMLRYDNCCPDSEVDSNVMHQTLEGAGTGVLVAITLVSYQPERNWKPCVSRWKSFGWEVRLETLVRDGQNF